jgi:hypothetical protein
MNNKNYLIGVIILILLAGAIVLISPKNQADNVGRIGERFEAEVEVLSPEPGQVVSSPLEVAGKAKGTWFFEANIVVTLKDQNGNILAKEGFMTADEWMTTDYANFSGTLSFSVPDTEYGLLLIEKDNPSGLEEFDAEFVVPIRFR